MSKILFYCLLIYSSISSASTVDNVEEIRYTTLQIVHIFDEQHKDNIKDLIDLADKEDKTLICIGDYMKKQSKSYSKIVQNDLYDLINNFDNISARLQGRKERVEKITFDNKIEALAKVQCDAYYSMGMLK